MGQEQPGLGQHTDSLQNALGEKQSLDSGLGQQSINKEVKRDAGLFRGELGQGYQN